MDEVSVERFVRQKIRERGERATYLSVKSEFIETFSQENFAAYKYFIIELLADAAGAKFVPGQCSTPAAQSIDNAFGGSMRNHNRRSRPPASHGTPRAAPLQGVRSEGHLDDGTTPRTLKLKLKCANRKQKKCEQCYATTEYDPPPLRQGALVEFIESPFGAIFTVLLAATAAYIGAGYMRRRHYEDPDAPIDFLRILPRLRRVVGKYLPAVNETASSEEAARQRRKRRRRRRELRKKRKKETTSQKDRAHAAAYEDAFSESENHADAQSIEESIVEEYGHEGNGDADDDDDDGNDDDNEAEDSFLI
eukprot:g2371.t1